MLIPKTLITIEKMSKNVLKPPKTSTFLKLGAWNRSSNGCLEGASLQGPQVLPFKALSFVFF